MPYSTKLLTDLEKFINTKSRQSPEYRISSNLLGELKKNKSLNKAKFIENNKANFRNLRNNLEFLGVMNNFLVEAENQSKLLRLDEKESKESKETKAVPTKKIGDEKPSEAILNDLLQLGRIINYELFLEEQSIENAVKNKLPKWNPKIKPLMENFHFQIARLIAGKDFKSDKAIIEMLKSFLSTIKDNDILKATLIPSQIEMVIELDQKRKTPPQTVTNFSLFSDQREKSQLTKEDMRAVSEYLTKQFKLETDDSNAGVNLEATDKHFVIFIGSAKCVFDSNQNTSTQEKSITQCINFLNKYDLNLKPIDFQRASMEQGVIYNIILDREQMTKLVTAASEAKIKLQP